MMIACTAKKTSHTIAGKTLQAACVQLQANLRNTGEPFALKIVDKRLALRHKKVGVVQT